MIQKVGHRASKPPTTANLKPAEVTAQRSGQEDGVGVQLELFKGDGLLDGNLPLRSERKV